MRVTVRVPVAFRNKCERVKGPQPERARSICAGVNATRTSGTGPERDRNANRNRCEHGHRGIIRPCSHHSFGAGTVPERNRAPVFTPVPLRPVVPERVRLALWCERATGPVPEPFQLPVTFVDSQPILHNISKRSSRHFMTSCHRSFDRRQVQIGGLLRLIGVPLIIKYAKNARLP